VLPLLTASQKQHQLDANAQSLDIRVREEINKTLGNELLAYVGELRQVIAPPHRIELLPPVTRVSLWTTA